jgi:hypothetical protein
MQKTRETDMKLEPTENEIMMGEIKRLCDVVEGLHTHVAQLEARIYKDAQLELAGIIPGVVDKIRDRIGKRLVKEYKEMCRTYLRERMPKIISRELCHLLWREFPEDKRKPREIPVDVF